MINIILVGLIFLLLLMTLSSLCKQQPKRMVKSRRPRQSFKKGSYSSCGASDDFGLNDLTQDTSSRGFMPLNNQPNHTTNLWKSGCSHPDIDNLGNIITSVSSDLQTPIRGKVVYYTPHDVSNMHLVSRFGGCGGS
jgi:hypothetical protein